MKIILTILSILLFGCQTKSVEDDLISHHFRSTEIKSLNKILDYFESKIVLVNSNTNNLDSAYQIFFKKMKNNLEAGIFDLGINLEDQRNFFSKLDSATFNEIWKIYKIKGMTSLGPVYKCIMRYNPNGDYEIFLEDLAAQNDFVNEYFKMYKASGDLSPKMEGDVILNHEYFDISSKDERLFLAIHYLMANYILTIDYERPCTVHNNSYTQ